MPELPEVQTIVNDLIALELPGRRICGARVYWPKTVAYPDAPEFCRRIQDRSVTAIWRRAKYIGVELSGELYLLIHLRMTGRLDWLSADVPRSPHEHVIFDFPHGRQLRFHDTRKFGRMWLTANPDDVLGHLGPEPLDQTFTARQFVGLLSGRHRQLKPFLLDQRMLAGLGNIYVDEALWRAGLHPCRPTDSLGWAHITALHRSIRRVLRQGLKNMGTTLGTGQTNYYSVARRRGRNADQLNVFRRTGAPCPRCGQTISRTIVGQRATHYCPRCQKWP